MLSGCCVAMSCNRQDCRWRSCRRRRTLRLPNPCLARLDVLGQGLKLRDLAVADALRADLAAIPAALDLAQATLRVIRQNLFWAFFYNAAAIPLAALGFLSPVVCALAMGLSDVVVIGNALRLRRR